MNNWRPKDWEGLIERLAKSNKVSVYTQSILMPIEDDSAEAFEQGADAILESLKKQAILHDFKKEPKTIYLNKGYGYLVFIDEVNNEVKQAR